MELLDGIDLERLVRKEGPLPVPRVIHILRQVCHSLAEAHQHGMIHRDVKPANIFLCRYGRDVDFIKLLDFGLVKQSGSAAPDMGLTRIGGFAGTPAYASPEMIRGAEKLDCRADIYALGCVAFWLLTGTVVFEASTALEMLMKHATEPPEPPSRLAEQLIPQELDRLVLQCLEKRPEARIASAEELDLRLAEIAEVCPWSTAEARRWWELRGKNYSIGSVEPADALPESEHLVSKFGSSPMTARGSSISLGRRP
jgi:serine/threonine-protein kinase